METLRFTVVGEDRLHCAGCEQRVSSALRRLAGVHAVRASAQTQRVDVTIDAVQVRPEQVRARLEQLGYEVEEAGHENA